MLSQVVRAVAPKSLIVLSLFIILSACATAAVQAQTTERMVFNVPFEFTAGGERLPAGEYAIRPTSRGGAAYFIQSRDGRSVAAVSVKNTLRADENASQAQLTFNVYAGQYYLSQVRPGGDGAGAEFHKSRAEREVAKSATESRRVRVIASRR